MRLAAALLSLAVSSAHADDMRRERIEAVAAHAADIATTGAGLALGAVEANPLGLLLLPVKAIGYARIKAAPEAEQPALWSAYEAMGWGAAANNACVIAAIASGGPAMVPCLAVGAVAAGLSWVIDKPRRERAEFDAVCDMKREQNPELVCSYTP